MKAVVAVVAILMTFVGLAALIATSIWLYSVLNAPLWVWVCWALGTATTIFSTLLGQLVRN